MGFFFFQAEDGIRDFCLSRGLGDVYKRQTQSTWGEHIQDGVNTDILIYVTAEKGKPGEDYLAWAAPCAIAANFDNRPIAGQINLHGANILSHIGQWDKLMNTVIHEMMHILVFSPALAKFYVNANLVRLGFSNVYQQKMVRNYSTYIIATPKVKESVRKYFNCDKMEGMELENQGGEMSMGAHWERRLFYNELMTASISEVSIISETTLSLFEDSGWYRVNYSMAENLEWGKGKGCEFVYDDCIQMGKPAFSEFCSEPNSWGCSYTGVYKAVCLIDKSGMSYVPQEFDYFGDGTAAADLFADNCPYYYPLIDCMVPNYKFAFTEEEFGVKSRCFTGTAVLKSKQYLAKQGNKYFRCLESECMLVGNQFQLLVKVGQQTLVCSRSFQQLRIPDYVGTLDCPDLSIFCKQHGSIFEPPKDLPCVNDCTGRGKCVDGQCQCYQGATGQDCSESYCYFNCGGHGECLADTLLCLSLIHI
eukprot:TRINITY_DN6096_c0_g1_i4.p1 TRINITY_DN6096_c0_g1~~TRINITY_DN6096_c0_g1_i4.p1  ORF type:complete len:476 (+),score=92.34 TRINITY_DN6096_c0_g1_i4:3-1430(+)